MENMMGDSNSKRLLLQEELLQGLQLAKQLQIYFQMPSSSKETHELLIQRIISTFEKALEMLNWKGPSGSGSGSPPLSTGSPRSEDSDRDLHDNRKRNSVARWTKHIRVSPGVGVEGPLDDGYSWRKYGQKDILGATYPRGYYRCTHRNVQGCLATKQVQRSDEDPTVFEITYRGKHTCMAASNVVSPSENTNPLQQQLDNVLQSLQQKPNELLMNLRESLRVQTESLDSPNQSFHPSTASTAPFYFPSTSELNPSPLLQQQQQLHQGFAENFNSASYNNMSSASYGSQINDIIPAAASSASSPTVGLEIPFGHLEFDAHNFTFDNSRFFS